MNKIQKQIRTLLFSQYRVSAFALKYLDLEEIGSVDDTTKTLILRTMEVIDCNLQNYLLSKINLEITQEELDSLFDSDFSFPYNELLELRAMHQSFLKFQPRLIHIARILADIDDHILTVIPNPDNHYPYIGMVLDSNLDLIHVEIPKNMITYNDDDDDEG